MVQTHLRCGDARGMMSEYLDGRLDEDDARRLSQHMAGCAECTRHWQAMQRVSSLFQSAEMALPPPDFTARVMQRIRDADAEKARPRLKSPPLVAAWATLAVVLLVVCTFVVLGGVQAAQGGAAARSSLDIVALSMSISQAALQTATGAESIVQIGAALLRDTPAPLLALLAAWLMFGTIALSLTVAGLVAAYQPTFFRRSNVENKH